MRVLLAVAVLMMCGVAGGQQQAKPYVTHPKGWDCLETFEEKDAWAVTCWKRIEQPQPEKQEKAQPAIPPCADGTAGCYLTAAPYDHTNFPLCKDAAKGQPCWSVPPLAFDLPAKETIEGAQCIGGGCGGYAHYSCQDVAPDWKQRVLLDSADGKHHCYAFYLLEQKP